MLGTFRERSLSTEVTRLPAAGCSPPQGNACGVLEMSKARKNLTSAITI
jgi:hypothetical protein